MPVSSNYRRIGKLETGLAVLFYKEFRRMSKYLQEHYEEYLDRAYDINQEYYRIQDYPKLYKAFQDMSDEPINTPLADLRRKLDIEGLVRKASKKIKKVAEIGFKKCFRLITHQVELDLQRYENPIKDYDKFRMGIELSNYKGNISNNIKNAVVSILKDGIDRNLTPKDIAEQLQGLDSTIFSEARAKTIAVTELGKAYEYGNYQPIKKLEEMNIPVEKRRLTCRDDKVRPKHREAEEEGWIDSKEIFKAVNQLIPPEGINCRCTVQYRIKQ